MNRIDRPNFFDDHVNLLALSNNNRLDSYPQLRDHVGLIRQAYTAYVAANGNARVIAKVDLPDPIPDLLRNHYGSPPKDIAYIGEIRRRSGIRTCPMCGSMRGGTLDHLLPKEDYPVFSIFGLNLVPGCNCNTLRARVLTGPGLGERILHPYFDDVLGGRLLAAQIDNLGPVPSISLRLLLDPAHPDFAAVNFHFEKLIKRTQLVDYLVSQWAKLVARPKGFTTQFRRDPVSRAELVEILEAELERIDDHHESLNSWDSIFAVGLLDEAVVDWLFSKFSAPGRAAGEPLVLND